MIRGVVVLHLQCDGLPDHPRRGVEGVGGCRDWRAGVNQSLGAADDMIDVKRGDVAGVTLFTPGDIIEVSALSKAKGFQGVVKRYRFAGDLATHGRKHTERAPGSIGGGGRAGGRVIKGKRMAGRMGGDRVTVKNLRILAVDSKTNTIIISGAVPGHPGALVEIRG